MQPCFRAVLGRPAGACLWMNAQFHAAPTYSFPGVVHGLTRSLPIRSASQPVNNAAAMRFSTFDWLPIFCLLLYFGFGSGTNSSYARLTSKLRPFDRSRNPNTDTHPQVTTFYVSLYVLRPAFTTQHSVT